MYLTRIMSMSVTSTLLVVGAIEGIIGAALIFMPSISTEWIVGRTLTVGASQTGVATIVSQMGSQRLTVSLFLLAIGVCGHSETIAPDAISVLASIAVAYFGFLQPYMLRFRSHYRTPVGNQIFLCMLEGFALLVSIAADDKFDMGDLATRPGFVFATVAMVCSLLLSLMGRRASPEIGLDDTPTLFNDENRHQLSPQARKLNLIPTPPRARAREPAHALHHPALTPPLPPRPTPLPHPHPTSPTPPHPALSPFPLSNFPLHSHHGIPPHPLLTRSAQVLTLLPHPLQLLRSSGNCSREQDAFVSADDCACPAHPALAPTLYVSHEE